MSMNRLYRLVYNASQGVIQVVAIELTNTMGGGKPGRRRTRKRLGKPRMTPVQGAAAMALLLGLVLPMALFTASPAQAAGGSGVALPTTINQTGNLIATGDNSIALVAQSQAAGGNGNITVNILNPVGSTSLILGGLGNGAGVYILNGANNMLNNAGVISALPTIDMATNAITGVSANDGTVTYTPLAGGASTTVSGVSGYAVRATDGNDQINNTGLIMGSVDLGTGANGIYNKAGAVFDSGSIINVGAGNTVTNAGIWSPGGNLHVFTTNVTGNFIQTSSGTLDIQVTPTAGTAAAGTGYDLLNVNGAATLSGTLNVLAASGTYAVGSKYDIVQTSSGVSGMFTNTKLGGAYGRYLMASLTYGTRDVYLTLNPTQNAFTSGQGTPIDDWNTQYSLLNGEQTVLNTQGGTGGGILHVNGKPDPAVWVRGLMGHGNAYGGVLNNNATLIGYGDEIRPGLIIGAAFGSTGTRTSTNLDIVKTRSYGLYLYSLYNRGPIFLDATATAGTLHTDSTRNLQPTGLIATGSASGSYAGVSARAGYHVTRGALFVTPYVGAGFLHTHRGSYTETGAGTLNLSYAAANYNIGIFQAGARIGVDLQEGPDVVMSPWIEVGGVSYTGDRAQHLTVTLGSQQQVLPATGTPSGATTVNAGLAFMTHGNWSGQLVYRSQYTRHTYMGTGDMKVVYRW